MYCRIPSKIKRYLTEPQDFKSQQKSKYSNLTLQEIKIQLNPFQALNQIRVPSVSNNRLKIQKISANPAHIQQKYYLHSNPNKNSKEIHFPSQCNNNGYEFPQTSENQLMSKKSNPLFIVNTLMDILKDDNKQSTSHSVHKKYNLKIKGLENNQFNQFQSQSMKIHRPPRFVKNQMNRLTRRSKCSRRKIYSQQKLRQKQKDVGQLQLLTFYKQKKTVIHNTIWKVS